MTTRRVAGAVAVDAALEGLGALSLLGPFVCGAVAALDSLRHGSLMVSWVAAIGSPRHSLVVDSEVGGVLKAFAVR